MSNSADPSRWACGECAAQPGEPCIWPDGDHTGQFHSARVAAAAYWRDGSGGDGVSSAAFEAAVESSGLV